MVDDESRGVEPSAEPENSISDVEKQRIINELRHEVLDHRSRNISWWLTAIAVFLVIAGYVGFTIFQKLEADARRSVERLEKMVDVAQKRVGEVKATASDAENSAKKAETIVAQMKKIAEESKKTAADAKKTVEKIRREYTKAKDLTSNIQSMIDASRPPIDTKDQNLSQKITEAQDLEKNDIAKAINLWQEIATQGKTTEKNLAANAWFSIGSLLGQQKQLSKAIEAYREAILLNPKFAEAYINRGIAKAKLGEVDSVIADFEKAIRVRPDYALPHLNLGESYATLGQKDKAKEYLTKARDLARKAENKKLIANAEQALKLLDKR